MNPNCQYFPLSDGSLDIENPDPKKQRHKPLYTTALETPIFCLTSSKISLILLGLAESALVDRLASLTCYSFGFGDTNHSFILTFEEKTRPMLSPILGQTPRMRKIFDMMIL